MRPSDEKVWALAHAGLRALEREKCPILDREGVLREIRGAIEDVLRIEEEIEAAAQAKIRSHSRRIEPGTREWADLHARYVGEERRKRGL